MASSLPKNFRPPPSVHGPLRQEADGPYFARRRSFLFAGFGGLGLSACVALIVAGVPPVVVVFAGIFPFGMFLTVGLVFGFLRTKELSYQSKQAKSADPAVRSAVPPILSMVFPVLDDEERMRAVRCIVDLLDDPVDNVRSTAFAWLLQLQRQWGLNSHELEAVDKELLRRVWVHDNSGWKDDAMSMLLWQEESKVRDMERLVSENLDLADKGLPWECERAMFVLMGLRAIDPERVKAISGTRLGFTTRKSSEGGASAI